MNIEAIFKIKEHFMINKKYLYLPNEQLLPLGQGTDVLEELRVLKMSTMQPRTG